MLVANGAYHGSLPWCNPDAQGTVPGDRANLDYFDFNDLDQRRRGDRQRHPDDLAAVIVSPYRQPRPASTRKRRPASSRSACASSCDRARRPPDPRRGPHRHAAELGSAWRRFGVAPDLSAWGKAIANGYALAALVGKEAIREAAAKVFATGSFWWTGDAMAAGLATLELMEREDSLGKMRDWGTRFQEGLGRRGRASAASAIWSPDRRRCPTRASPPTTTIAPSNDIFTAECGKHGLYLHPRHNWFVSAAMDERDLDQALAAVQAGVAAVASAAR